MRRQKPSGDSSPVDGNPVVPRRVASSEPVYFAHVPKTAGTSLFSALDTLFETNQIYPKFWHETPLRVQESVTGRFRFYRGHFGHDISAVDGREMYRITVLRDPIEQTLSFIGQMQRNSEHPLHERVLSHVDLLGLLFDPEIRVAVWNNQTCFFGLEVNPDTGLLFPTIDLVTRSDDPSQEVARLARAQEILACATRRLDSYDIVGLTEQLDDTWALIADAFGVDSRPPLGRLNVFDQRLRRDSLSPRELAAILDITALDRRLYAAQSRRFARTAVAVLGRAEADYINLFERVSVLMAEVPPATKLNHSAPQASTAPADTAADVREGLLASRLAWSESLRAAQADRIRNLESWFQDARNVADHSAQTIDGLQASVAWYVDALAEHRREAESAMERLQASVAWYVDALARQEQAIEGQAARAQAAEELAEHRRKAVVALEEGVAWLRRQHEDVVGRAAALEAEIGRRDQQLDDLNRLLAAAAGREGSLEEQLKAGGLRELELRERVDALAAEQASLVSIIEELRGSWGYRLDRLLRRGGARG